MFLHRLKKTALQETQSCELDARPTGGTFTLTYGDQVTAAIAYDAAAATVQAALDALSNVTAGDITVSMLEQFSRTRFAEFVFTVGKAPLGLLVMNVGGLTTTAEAVFTKIGDAPANSFGQIIGYNQAEQSLIVRRPNDNNIGYCRTVIISEGISSGKNGVSAIDGICVVKKAPGESINPGDRIGTQKDGWFAKKDDNGMWYVIAVDGDYLYIRLCQMWPALYIGGRQYGYGMLATDKEGRRIFDYLPGDEGAVYGIDVGHDGKIYIAHALSGGTTHEVLSPAGKQIWSCAATAGSSIRVRGDGCYFLNYGYALYSDLRKYNANNELVWTYHINNSSHFNCITLGPNDTIIVHVEDTGAGSNSVRKLTDNGGTYDVDWVYDYEDEVETDGLAVVLALAVDGSGNVYAGGDGAQVDPISIFKLTSGGVFVWSYWGQRRCEGLALDSSGYLYAVNSSGSGDEGDRDQSVIKLTSGGAKVDEAFGKTQILYCVAVDIYDKIFVGGHQTAAKESLWKLDTDLDIETGWPIDVFAEPHCIAIRYLEQ